MDDYAKELWLRNHGDLQVFHHSPHDDYVAQWSPKYSRDGLTHGFMTNGNTYAKSVSMLYSRVKEALWGWWDDQ